VQSERLRELFLACQHHGHELLLEPTGFTGAITSADLETRIDELLEGGVRPDWWLVPWVHDPECLEAIAAAVVHRDRYCRGILLADPAHAGRGGAEAPSLPQHPLFSGFVLRQRVASLAGDWLCGKLDDSTLQHALCQLLSSATEQWALVA
jgi:myo-inositol catabolism protein IolC